MAAMDQKLLFLASRSSDYSARVTAAPPAYREGVVDDHTGVMVGNRSEGLFDGGPVGLIVVDSDGKIIDFDESAAAVLAINSGGIASGTWFEMLPLQVRMRLGDEWSRAVAAPAKKALRFRFHDLHGGPTITASFVASVVRSTAACRFIGTLLVDAPERSLAPDKLAANRIDVTRYSHQSSASPLIACECKECYQKSAKAGVVGYLYAEREAVLDDEDCDSATAMDVKCKLLAGIGHEMHQPIYAIQNFTSAARQHLRLGQADKVNEMLTQIDRQVARANDIGARLRQFALQSKQDRKAVDIHTVIRSCSDIAMMYAADANADFSLLLEASQSTVRCDSLQIQQVLLNLIRNSTDSLAEGDSSKRKIIARTFNRDSRVVVEVIDTGPGVQNSHIDRIFDHFFTTKQSGLGIGLPFCRTIIDAHGGSLRLQENRPGRVVFEMALPLDTPGHSFR